MSTYRDDFYREPQLYDLEYQALQVDLPWYAGLASRADRVLELGCGTGRVTLPMARTGAQVTAVDLAEPMLVRLRERLAEEPELRVATRQGDARTVELNGRWPLVVMPFNSIQHLYEAREIVGLLERIRGWLAPGGRFALDLLIPDPAYWQRDPDGVHEVRRFPDPMGGTLTSWENGWYDRIRQIHHIRYHYRRSDGSRQLVEMPLRMFYPAEFLGLVDLAGFEVLERYGDFHGRPLEQDSSKLVLVLQPRRSAE